MKKRDFNQIITRLVRLIFLLEGVGAVFLGLFDWSEGFQFRIDSQSLMNAFIALLGFVLTFIPEATERILRNRIRFSSALKCAIVLFIFGAEFCGEIRNFYFRFSWWDTLLHSMSGVILAMIGFMLVYALNDSGRISVTLSPFFIALFAFTFALASGALWEIFEYGGDRLLGMNMQKYLPPEGVLYEAIGGQTALTYSAEAWRFDAGLIDTMNDLICDALAALAVSVVGYLSLKTRNRVLKKLACLPAESDISGQEEPSCRSADPMEPPQ